MSFVLRTFPNHLAKDVPLDSVLQVFFMIDLNMEFVTPNNIILFNLDEQKHEPIELEYRNRVLTIRPVQKMSPLTHYQLELVDGEKGIQDIAGNKLDSAYTIEFFTGDVLDLKAPVLISPTDLSEIRGDVRYSWMPVEKANHYELQISRSNTFDVLVWPITDHRIYNTEVVPAFAYQKGQYYARVRAVDAEGTKSAWSNVIRLYYNGEDDLPEQPYMLPQGISHVQLLKAMGGETVFKFGRPYKPGTGQLSVYLNGMKVQPCSKNSLDGDYREVDEYTVEFVEPLMEGDAIEFRIEGVSGEIVQPQQESHILTIQEHEQAEGFASELDHLQQHFLNLVKVQEIPLTIVSSKPADGAIHIPVDSIRQIVIEFSEDIDPNSIDSTTFYMVAQKN
jgi:hypothetical protein